MLSTFKSYCGRLRPLCISDISGSILGVGKHSCSPLKPTQVCPAIMLDSVYRNGNGPFFRSIRKLVSNLTSPKNTCPPWCWKLITCKRKRMCRSQIQSCNLILPMEISVYPKNLMILMKWQRSLSCHFQTKCSRLVSNLHSLLRTKSCCLLL